MAQWRRGSSVSVTQLCTPENIHADLGTVWQSLHSCFQDQPFLTYKGFRQCMKELMKTDH